MRMSLFLGVLVLAQVQALSITAQAAESDEAPQGELKKVDIQGLKKKYWNQGGDSGPAQNRIYSRALKLHVMPNVVFYNPDPFLNLSTYGITAGFSVSDYLTFEMIYWRFAVKESNAYEAFLVASASALGPNTNNPTGMVGGEVLWCPFYGKLSILNSIVLHMDFFLLAGAGKLDLATHRQSGYAKTTSTIPIWLGIGEELHLTKFLSLRADLRLLRQQEDTYEQWRVASLGTMTPRTTFTTAATVGLSIMGP